MENNIVLNIVVLTIEAAAILAVGGKLILVIKSLYAHQMAMAKLMQENVKHQMVKENFFDLQARSMQSFLEEFLGRDFNVQCQFIKPISNNKPFFYHLWVWKRYETKDMGVMVNSADIPGMITAFMRKYYSEAYFTDAMAFPKD